MPAKKHNLPKNCVKKTNKDGRAHYYFQRGDYRVALPHPDSEDFMAKYQAALDRVPDAAHLAKAALFKTVGMNKGELDQYFRQIETGARQRARAAGREYTLPTYWGADKYVEQGGRCALTGIVMQRAKGRFDAFSPSIDRIDSAGGYTPENCQLTLLHINLAKRDLGEAEFIKLCRAVVFNARRTERERIVNVERHSETTSAGPVK
jgi:hypothetical protein